MRSVSIEVKKTLNEGSWGYKPNNSDDYLDSTHDLCEPIIEYLENILNGDENVSKYTAIGLFNELLNANIWRETSFGDDFKHLVDDIKIAADDLKENKNEWSDPNKFISELNNQMKEI